MRGLWVLLADVRRGARVVEEARLESVYTPKAYHGFESRFLRKLLNLNYQLINLKNLDTQ